MQRIHVMLQFGYHHILCSGHEYEEAPHVEKQSVCRPEAPGSTPNQSRIFLDLYLYNCYASRITKTLTNCFVLFYPCIDGAPEKIGFGKSG